MTKVNLYKIKADYFEQTCFILLDMAFYCALAMGKIEIQIDLDEQKPLIEKALQEDIKEVKKFLSEKPENLPVFFDINFEELQSVKYSEQNILYICANTNIAFSQILKALSNMRIKKEVEYELWNKEQDILLKSNRAMGYWTAKMESYKGVLKGNNTIKLQEQKKIEAVRKAYIKFINSHDNSTVKNTLSKLSKNKMAEQVLKIAIEDVKKLSVDTVIRYLDRQDFKYYPWKKKTTQ